MANRLHLLELPVDVLNLILTPLLVSSTPVPLCPCTRSPIDPTDVFLIHPALYTIAAPLFYRVNTFVLDASGSHGQHVRRLLMPGSGVPMTRAREQLLTTRDALMRIAKLHFRADRMRGWLHDVIVPTIQDMVVQGSLEHFVLRVSYSNCEGSQSWIKHMQHRQDKDLDMFTRPPLEGLLRILADPYLRTSELWVDACHIPVWCRFHPRQICRRARISSNSNSGTPPPSAVPPPHPLEKTPGRSSGVDGRDGGAVEIDWRELRRVVDPERRDVAVAWTEDVRAMRTRDG